ncbi:MAG TPA: hypothetical protein DCQ57_14315 [Enterobacteriaceae bacterium]|nr:hypothetical protein [Enterobacteriaceae bacterium]
MSELQYRSSIKCPSRPTICQQNVKTSIQVSVIYNRGEKRQTKIKKTSRGYFQHGKLCYRRPGRIIVLVICSDQPY